MNEAKPITTLFPVIVGSRLTSLLLALVPLFVNVSHKQDCGPFGLVNRLLTLNILASVLIVAFYGPCMAMLPP